ncbi:MAG TPA: hypothetical protein PLB25_10255 [Rhodoferax sp.]|nr:hypothetical protein [Rhodoferax sp.]
MVAGASLAEEIEALQAPMRSLRSDLVLVQLHAMMARQIVPHDQHTP